MNANKVLAILVGFTLFILGILTTTISAQDSRIKPMPKNTKVQMLTSSNARALTSDEISKLLPANKARTENSPYGIPQAKATIEATGLSTGETYVLFQTTEPLSSGSYLVFTMNMPNGNSICLGGFMVQSEYRWGAQLWNGNFPGIWPGGWTRFAVYLFDAGGNLSYTSTLVNVQACCGTQPGPIRTATVSTDGYWVEVKGNFLETDTLATLGGMPAPTFFEYDPSTGEPIIKVLNQYGIQGQTNLTVCSNGECASRVMYINRQ
ncbi:MAG: hypothetical protein WC609_02870 [Candidatus Paceibacterota bacterium]|jgi:hypothetical protein